MSIAAFSLNAAPAPVDYKLSMESDVKDLVARGTTVGMLVVYRAFSGVMFLTGLIDEVLPVPGKPTLPFGTAWILYAYRLDGASCSVNQKVC